jgi:hypothetical protein
MVNKRGIEMEMLAWWLTAIIIFVLMVAGYIILKNKDVSVLEYIKNLFVFNR